MACESPRRLVSGVIFSVLTTDSYCKVLTYPFITRGILFIISPRICLLVSVRVMDEKKKKKRQLLQPRSCDFCSYMEMPHHYISSSLRVHIKCFFFCCCVFYKFSRPVFVFLSYYSHSYLIIWMLRISARQAERSPSGKNRLEHPLWNQAAAWGNKKINN